MSDFDDNDPWGDAPDWAVSDSESISSSGNGNGNVSNDNKSALGQVSLPGAQHIIILLDAHPSMFAPYIRRSMSAVDSNKVLSTSTSNSYISPFDAALIACERLLHHRVHNVATTRTGKRDGVGILLFNCPAANLDPNSSDGGVDENHATASIRRFMELSPPGVDQIQTIRACMDQGNTGINANSLKGRRRDLKRELYAAKCEEDDWNLINSNGDIDNNVNIDIQTISLRSSFFECNKMFNDAKCVKTLSSTSKETEDSKTVWVFTNEHDPVQGSVKERELMEGVSKDLVESEVDIRLWALPRADREVFDRSIFYDYVTTLDENEGDGEDGEGDAVERGFSGRSPGEEDLDLDGLLEEVCASWNTVRKTQTIPMYLPDCIEHHKVDEANDKEMVDNTDGVPAQRTNAYPGIMLDIYQTIRIKKKPMPTTINSVTNKKTNKSTEILAKETGEIIAPQRIRQYAEFAGVRVPFTKEEVARIKRDSNVYPDEASLILFGFQPLASMSKIYQYPLIDRPLFAYPNDELVKGSKHAFSCLHSSMLRKKVIGLGELLQRVTATSRIVAIVPQDEELYSDGEQKRPPGFLLIPLAYEDDVRAIPDACEYVADEEMIFAAEAMMKNLKLENFVIGESFENPVLKSFWNYIESVALSTPLIDNDTDEDDTTWDVDEILSVCGTEIDAFKRILPEDEVMAKERKRKVHVKKADETGINWFQEYEDNTFEDLTVDELKAYCRASGERVGGRKTDLIARVKDHIRNRIENGETPRPVKFEIQEI